MPLHFCGTDIFWLMASGEDELAGELACGNLKNRTEILSLLRALPSVEVAEHEEILAFIENNQLMGRGLAYGDPFCETLRMTWSWNWRLRLGAISSSPMTREILVAFNSSGSRL
jgi:hypothetical protein